jgi:hypothetical protein
VDRPARAEQQHGDAAEVAVPAAAFQPLPCRPLVACRGDEVHTRECTQTHQYVQVHVERGQRHRESHLKNVRNEINTTRYNTDAPASPITKKRA